MRRKNTPEKTQQGLSLLQVIVSISLIAALSALALPAYNIARQRAAAAKCVGNLRQFGIGVSLRIADTGDYPPYKAWWPQEDGSVLGGSLWRSFLLNYLPVSIPLETCPSAEVRYRKVSTLGYGNQDFANYGWSSGASATPFRKSVTAQSPHRLFLMGDSTAAIAFQDNRGGSWAINPSSQYSDMANPNRLHTFSFRHQGYANLLFLDGHVEARRPMEIPLFRPQTQASKEFWDER